MAKHPYITFWVGDWLRDTRVLSMEAKGAWIDLLCYMANSKSTGVITGSVTDIARLIGASESYTPQILNELSEKDVCIIEFDAQKGYTIKSRRMMKDAITRANKSKAGTAGANSRYKKKPPVSETAITEDLTEQQQNTGIGNGIGNDNVNLGKGVGETLLADPYVNEKTVLTIPLCYEALKHSKHCERFKDQLAMSLHIDLELLYDWAAVFNRILEMQTIQQRALGEYCRYFNNWLRKEIHKGKTPKNYFDDTDNGTTNERPTGPTNNGGPGSRPKPTGASIADLQSLVRNSGTGTKGAM